MSEKPVSPFSAKQVGKVSDAPFSDYPPSPTVPSTDETLSNLYQRLMDAEEEKRQLKKEMHKLESLVQRHESLRMTRVGVCVEEDA